MKYKNKNRIYLILILIGIFTLSSFVFDQMVINSEDKVREYNFLVKKYQSDEARTYATMLDIQNLQARNQFKVQSFDYRSQFLQKTILAILDKNYKNKAFSIEVHEYLNSIFFTRYNTIIYEIHNDSNLSLDFYNTIPIRIIKANLGNELNKTEMKKINRLDEEIKDYAILTPIDLTFKMDKYFTKIESSLKKKNFTLEGFIDKRKKITESLKIYDEFTLNLKKVLATQTKIAQFYMDKTSYFLTKKKKFETKKNLYILISVLCQIISLFFLLILFKNLLNLNKS